MTFNCSFKSKTPHNNVLPSTYHACNRPKIQLERCTFSSSLYLCFLVTFHVIFCLSYTENWKTDSRSPWSQSWLSWDLMEQLSQWKVARRCRIEALRPSEAGTLQQMLLPNRSQQCRQFPKGFWRERKMKRRSRSEKTDGVTANEG